MISCKKEMVEKPKEFPVNIKYSIHFSSHCGLCKKHITSVTFYSAYPYYFCSKI